jgi:hypothetical protein
MIGMNKSLFSPGGEEELWEDEVGPDREHEELLVDRDTPHLTEASLKFALAAGQLRSARGLVVSRMESRRSARQVAGCRTAIE